MSSCILPLFGLGQFKKALNSIINRIKSIEDKDISNEFKESLRECKIFTVVSQNFTDKDALNDSLNQLEQEIDSLDSISEEQKNKLKDAVNSFRVTDSQSVNGDSQYSLTDGFEDVSTIKQETLNETLDTIFKDNQHIANDFLRTFNGNLTKLAIINIEKQKVVRDTLSLNQNIEDFLDDCFRVLSAEFGDKETSMFINHELNQDYYKILSKARNTILALLNENNYSSTINEQWANKINGKSSDSYQFLNLIYSYVNLVHFDSLLQRQFGKTIQFDDEQTVPIQANMNSTVYKYKFARKTNNLVKDWTGDNSRDAIKEMGNLSKIVISSIKIEDINGTKTSIPLDPTSATIAVQNLLKYIYSLSDRVLGERQEELNQTRLKGPTLDSMETFLSYVLDSIKKNQNILNTLRRFGIYDKELNILHTLYYNLYKSDYSEGRTQSIRFIEDSDNLQYTFGNNYPVAQAVNASITYDVSPMSYLQVEYDRDTERNLVEVKSKSNTDPVKFSIVNKVNNKILDPNLIGDIKVLDGQIIIKTDNLEIHANTANNSLLSKSYKNDQISVFYNGKEINIEKSSEQELQSILKWIKNQIGIDLYSDSDSRTKFTMLSKDRSNVINGLITTAARSRYIQEIYKLTQNKLLAPSETNIESSKTGDMIKKDLEQFKDIKDKFFYISTTTSKYIRTLYPQEKWLDTLSAIEVQFSGVPQSVISDLSGNKIPNFSVKFMGSDVSSILFDISQHQNVDVRAPLLSVLNGFQDVVSDYDVSLNGGFKKKVEDMNLPELYYHAIVDKFGSLGQIFYVQPTTYSDKVKLLNYRFKRNIIADENTFIEEWNKSIGQYYRKIYDNVMKDFSVIFGEELSIKDLNDKLKNMTEEELKQEAVEKGVSVILDLHYRIDKSGYLYLNELLLFYNYIYNEGRGFFKAWIRQEKVKFINELIKSRFEIRKSKSADSFFNVTDQYGRKWDDGNNAILARVSDNGKIRNIIFTDDLVNVDDDFQLHPVLEQYFYTQSLYANALRFILTGCELNHPLKRDTHQVTEALVNNIVQGIENNFDNLILYSTIAQLAQLKRNVPIPGTITPMSQDTITGISSQVKTSVYKDTKAPVFDFSGHTGNTDAHDGSAFMIGPAYYLENNSLQENEVGVIRKPLFASYDKERGTGQLLKYAITVITNRLLRDSDSNNLDESNRALQLRNLLRKYTDIPWDDNLDITQSDLFYSEEFEDSSRDIDFFQSILKGNYLYVQRGNNYYQVQDLKRDSNGYYTEELPVSEYGFSDADTQPIKVYHYFDMSGNHYTTTDEKVIQQKLSQPEFRTINSIYTLWESLGGMYSMQLINSRLRPTEISNFAVANYIINVATHKDGMSYKFNQSNYDQPLRNYFIGYMANNSAMKEGAANRNSNKELYDNSSNPGYTIMETRYYGIQQDSDHIADESEASEPTQVISSLDIGGYVHDQVKQVYEAMSQNSNRAIKGQLETLKQFLNNPEQFSEQFYESIARLFIANFNPRDNEQLRTLLSAIRDELGKSDSQSRRKLPLSSPTIFKRFLTTISSYINRVAIKRKFTGSADVLAPSYNIIMKWDLGDGSPLMRQDLLRESQKWAKENEQVPQLVQLQQRANNGDLSQENYYNEIIKLYLQSKQNEVKTYPLFDGQWNTESLDQFNPTENVDIIIQDSNNNSRVIPLSLDSLDDYYGLMRDTENYLKNKLKLTDINGLTINIRRNITRPINLQPLICRFKYTDDNGKVRELNIFNTDELYKKYQAVQNKASKEELKKLQKDVDIMLINLEEKHQYNGKQATIIKKTKAELVASNNYATRFQISSDKTVREVSTSDDIFNIRPTSTLSFRDITFAMLSGDNKNTYIGFNNNLAYDKSSQITDIPFVNIKRIPYEDSKAKTNNNEFILSRIIALDKDGNEICEIGRDIICNSDKVQQDSSGQFVYPSGEKIGQPVPDQESYKVTEDKKIVKTVLYLTNNQIERISQGRNGTTKTTKYRLININPNLLGSVLSGDEDIANVESELIDKLYHYKEYKVLQVNLNASEFPKEILSIIGTPSSPYFQDMQDIKELCWKTFEQTESLTAKGGFRVYKKILQTFYNTLAGAKKSSYDLSRDFISSRIPAQNLASFMAMRLIGYTGVGTNQAFVSHFQLFLQGSNFE